MDGRADCTHDRRFRALVLLTTFVSLRWGEVSALRRTDVDLDAETVRIRVTFVERSTGDWSSARPSPRLAGALSASRRPSFRCSVSMSPPTSRTSRAQLMFPGAEGGPLRRSDFNTCMRWVDVVKEMGLPGLHLHDLCHADNMFAAESGAGLKDLMARMGRDNARRDDLPARRTRCRQDDHGRDRQADHRT